jgi:hypothetical protein
MPYQDNETVTQTLDKIVAIMDTKCPYIHSTPDKTVLEMGQQLKSMSFNQNHLDFLKKHSTTTMQDEFSRRANAPERALFHGLRDPLVKTHTILSMASMTLQEGIDPEEILVRQALREGIACLQVNVANYTSIFQGKGEIGEIIKTLNDDVLPIMCAEAKRCFTDPDQFEKETNAMKHDFNPDGYETLLPFTQKAWISVPAERPLIL